MHTFLISILTVSNGIFLSYYRDILDSRLNSAVLTPTKWEKKEKNTLSFNVSFIWK